MDMNFDESPFKKPLLSTQIWLIPLSRLHCFLCFVLFFSKISLFFLSPPFMRWFCNFSTTDSIFSWSTDVGFGQTMLCSVECGQKYSVPILKLGLRAVPCFYLPLLHFCHRHKKNLPCPVTWTKENENTWCGPCCISSLEPCPAGPSLPVNVGRGIKWCRPWILSKILTPKIFNKLPKIASCFMKLDPLSKVGKELGLWTGQGRVERDAAPMDESDSQKQVTKENINLLMIFNK